MTELVFWISHKVRFSSEEIRVFGRDDLLGLQDI